RDCKLTKQVLQELEVTLSNRNTENDWNKCLVMELGNKSSQLCVTTAVAFWAIWFSRNKFIHEGILNKAQEIASFVRNYTIEISQTEGITEFLQRNKNDIWRPPEGFVMGACEHQWQNVQDSTTIEAWACLQVVTFAEELGFQDICVEGDTLKVVKKLNDEHNDRILEGLLIERRASKFCFLKDQGHPEGFLRCKKGSYVFK
ncbi:hypothetical protein Golob_000816, partial [Gossypium lobatum]|nr:hypothetical protein [Gossypium lobatum]